MIRKFCDLCGAEAMLDLPSVRKVIGDRQMYAYVAVTGTGNDPDVCGLCMVSLLQELIATVPVRVTGGVTVLKEQEPVLAAWPDGVKR